MKSIVTGIISTSLLAFSLHSHAGYDTHPRFSEFAQELESEYGIKADVAKGWLAKAVKQQRVLDLIQKPAEKRLEWKDYQDIFLTAKRIKAGKAFALKYQDALKGAEEKYGVPTSVITAIIGVETFYGTRQGTFKALDSLATLAFDYPKRPLFWRELKALFALAEREQLAIDQIKGSYAGAMGYGQFIPTSYLSYAVDGNADGKVNLWTDPVDAIYSVANYFRRHGWRMNDPVILKATVSGTEYSAIANDKLKPAHTVASLNKMGVKVSDALPANASANLVRLEGKQGTEYWMGLHNYYVITRYNHSRLYAMAVHQLSQAFASME